MYRFPLQVKTSAENPIALPGFGRAAIISDAKGAPVLSLTLSGDASLDNERAQFICDTFNKPATAFLAHCQRMSALAGAKGDEESCLWWHRLSGNIRKAAAGE